MQILTKDWSYYQWVCGVGEIRVLSSHSIWLLSFSVIWLCPVPLRASFSPTGKMRSQISIMTIWAHTNPLNSFLSLLQLLKGYRPNQDEWWVCPLSSLQEIDGSTRGLTVGDWMKVYLQRCGQVSRKYGMVKSPGTRLYHFYSLKGGTSERYRHERGVAWQGGKQWIPWPSLPSPQILAGVFHGLNIIGSPETRQFR